MKLKKKIIILLSGSLLLGTSGEIFATHQNSLTEARIKIKKKKSSHSNKRKQGRNRKAFKKRDK